MNLFRAQSGGSAPIRSSLRRCRRRILWPMSAGRRVRGTWAGLRQPSPGHDPGTLSARRREGGVGRRARERAGIRWWSGGADCVGGGGVGDGTGGGRLEGDVIVVGWSHLIAPDGSRLWPGNDVIPESRDDVVVQEHHGATTSSRYRGRARLA